MSPQPLDKWDVIITILIILMLILIGASRCASEPSTQIIYDGPCPEEGLLALPVQPEYLEVSGLVCADGEPLYCQEAVVYYDDLPASEATILCYPQGDVLVWAVVLDG